MPKLAPIMVFTPVSNRKISRHINGKLAATEPRGRVSFAVNNES